MLKLALLALVATAAAVEVPKLAFETPSSKCSIAYEGEKLTTDCALGDGFLGKVVDPEDPSSGPAMTIPAVAASASTCHHPSRCVDKLIDGITDYNGNDWLTQGGERSSAWAMLDYGAEKQMLSFKVWNQNEYASNHREVQKLKIQVSNDPQMGWVTSMVCELSASNKAQNQPHSDCVLPSPKTGRFWKFTMLTFHGNDSYGGLMEIEAHGKETVTSPSLANLKVHTVQTSSCHHNSRCAKNLVDGSLRYNGNDWLTQGGERDGAWAIFDLGAPSAVHRMDIWNQNEYEDSHRDVKTVTVLGSDSPYGQWNTIVTDWRIQQSAAAASDPSAVLIKGTSDHKFRYYKLILNTFYGSDSYGGLMDVKFIGPSGQNVGISSHYHQVAPKGYTCNSHHHYSRSCDKLFDGTTSYSGNDWLTASNMRQDGYTIMDFGSAITVEKFVLYNQNEYADSHRDVKEVAVYYSDNGVDFTHLTNQVIMQSSAEAQDGSPVLIGGKEATPVVSARFWKIQLRSFYGSDAYGGLMEIKTFSASNPQTPTFRKYQVKKVMGNTCHHLSRCFDKLIDGSKDYNGNDWLSQGNERSDMWVVFDLGVAKNVEQLRIWNQNEYTTSHRELKKVDVQFSENPHASWDSLGEFPLLNTQAVKNNAGSYILLGGKTARYWRLRAVSFYGNDAYGGLMEVQFYGDGSSTVPNYNSVPILALQTDTCHDRSRCVQKLKDGNTAYNGNDWLTQANERSNSYVMADLGTGENAISVIEIYNQGEYSTNHREVKSMSIQYTNDLSASNWQYLSSAVPIIQTDTANHQPSQNVLVPDVKARYWRFEPKQWYGSDAYGGLMEIKFRSSKIEQGAPSWSSKSYSVTGQSSCHDTTRCTQNLNDGNTNYNGNDWLTQSGDTIGAWVSFDLQSNTDVQVIKIANQGEYADSHRDVKQIEIFTSNDNSGWTSIGNYPLTRSNANSGSQPYDELLIQRQARYWKMVIRQTHGADAYTGLMEVQFMA